MKKSYLEAVAVLLVLASLFGFRSHSLSAKLYCTESEDKPANRLVQDKTVCTNGTAFFCTQTKGEPGRKIYLCTVN